MGLGLVDVVVEMIPPFKGSMRTLALDQPSKQWKCQWPGCGEGGVSTSPKAYCAKHRKTRQAELNREYRKRKKGEL